MGPLGLVRQPLELALRLSEIALETAAGVVRMARSTLEQTDEEQHDDWQPSDETRYEAVEHQSSNGRHTEDEPAATATAAPPEPEVQDAPPPSAPPKPEHVDEGVELVEEFAEEGAEDGAGAELHIDEPWDGYDHLKAGDVIETIKTSTPAVVAAVQLYEGTRKKRRSVLQAAERRLATG